MNNKYKFIALIAFATSSLFAQQQRIIPCYTDEATKYYLQTHPEEAKQAEKEMSEAKLTPEYASRLANGNNSTLSTYAADTIPVVFHILHQGGSENVPDSYVHQALAEINKVYAKTTPDSASIDPYMKPAMTAVNYFFKLATLDPSGNCTNGIIRHFDANTNWDQTNPNYAYTWSRNQYLNIYIVKNICSGQPCPGPPSGGIIVGYTYIGGTIGASSASRDVVVYNCNFMLGIDARSMGHEFGHWLSLPHTFGATNTPGTCLGAGASDDFLNSAAPAVACTGVTDDTPKYAGAFSTCPAGTPNSCDVSNHANVQNIMDYSSCPLNFTVGQSKRMHNLMGSTAASRSNVVSAANKIATGIRNPQVCVPIANFHANALTACTGTNITFSDSSSNAHVTTWKWNFPGGTLQAGTTVNDSMPKVSYAAAGTYAVSYTASTTAGGNSISKASYINIVTNIASYNTAFTEGFETATLPGTDWSVTNTLGLDWAVTSGSAATGANSAWIDNFSNTAGNNSSLISPAFNISSFGSPKLTFKLAYKQAVSTNADKLQVFTSTDCENTWTSRWARSGATLATVTPPSGLPFTPSPAQFTTYTVNINGVSGSNNVRFMFEFFADPAGPGNYLYIDDINLYDAAAGINSFETQIGLDIYPNPSSGSVNIDFTLAEKHNVAVSVTDLLGRTIESIAAKQYAAGDAKLNIAEKAAYQAGVYLVNINIDGNIISKKIIIE